MRLRALGAAIADLSGSKRLRSALRVALPDSVRGLGLAMFVTVFFVGAGFLAFATTRAGFMNYPFRSDEWPN